MSDRLEWFTVTVPANTPIATPVVLPCVFTQGQVTEIDVKVPPGPAGSVGFFIGAGGSQYVPRTVGSFVVPDNDRFIWPLSNGIISGSWSVTAYNTDIWPHTIQVAFHVNELWNVNLSGGQQIGNSSAILTGAVTQSQGNATASADPLSPDSLIASVPSDLTSAA